jgi:hypothetical protein
MKKFPIHRKIDLIILSMWELVLGHGICAWMYNCLGSWVICDACLVLLMDDSMTWKKWKIDMIPLTNKTLLFLLLLLKQDWSTQLNVAFVYETKFCSKQEVKKICSILHVVELVLVQDVSKCAHMFKVPIFKKKCLYNTTTTNLLL